MPLLRIHPPAAQVVSQVQALHLSVWGGRRYGPGLSEAESAQWAAQMERLCLAMLRYGD